MKHLKYHVNCFLWLISGYACWVLGVYINAYVMAGVFTPALKHTRKLFHSSAIDTLALFAVSHIAEFILVFTFACLLSASTGKRRLWIASFVMGAIGYNLYDLIASFADYRGLYETFPSLTAGYFVQALIAYFIAQPCLAWLGASTGNKYYLKKTV